MIETKSGGEEPVHVNKDNIPNEIRKKAFVISKE